MQICPSYIVCVSITYDFIIQIFLSWVLGQKLFAYLV